MEADHPESNIPLYESLSEENEADMEENEHVPSTAASSKAAKVKDKKKVKDKEKGGVKRTRKWSKAWRTFKFVKDEKEAREKGEELLVRCTDCKYTIPYNSSFGTGNMLKHKKTCSRSRDIGQMIISSSQGSIPMQNGAFDPKIFRDMITDAVEFDALDNDLNPALEKTELDRYLEEKRMNRAIDIDVLDYWSTNQARFPNLALMARDILTIPISTVASESAFSQGGKVLDQYRSCLAHNIVESLICTRDWKFNEEVYHNYTLEQLTTDITRLDVTDDQMT